MLSPSKFKSVDFYRKIPKDLTEASLSGAGLSIIAALAIVFLFGMELDSYLSTDTSTSVTVDKSADGEFLLLDFNISFPSLSCEFASIDVSDVLGTNRLNITKTVRKFSIDSNLRSAGSEFHSSTTPTIIKHGDDINEESSVGSFSLSSSNFDKFTRLHPILVVNFFTPWCYWSQRLKASWEKAANIIRERYDPEKDGRILLGKVDCTRESDLCRRHHVQGYPSIRIFRGGSDIRYGYDQLLRSAWLENGNKLFPSRDDHGQHEHESYYGDRDTDSLVKTMENLVTTLSSANQEGKYSLGVEHAKRPAPSAGGCRVEGYVRVKKVPGNLIISARSNAHSFDTSQMNLSHVVTHMAFGRKVSPEIMSEAQRLIPEIGGSHNRLDGHSFINHHEFGANVTIEHYLQIVKTEVITGGGHELVEEYEYTAHSSLIQSLHMPAAKFHFELSPMQVLIIENQKSFSHFITNVCAIIGGIFTVAGILDSLLHNTLKFMKKIELGKNF